MTANSHNRTFGQVGEDLAAAYLLRNGYQILVRNFRYGRMELDIVARLKDEIIFVEVKTRSDDDKAVPEKVVGRNKQRNIRVAAEYYMESNELALPARFDIIMVMKAGSFEIEHWEDAFYPFDTY
ncbi:MAG: YraN family protein [Bacteroidia bacterium]|jgi:putative endonuclease